jgi:hypothetical protein
MRFDAISFKQATLNGHGQEGLVEVVFSLLHDHPHTCVAEAPLLYLVDFGAAVMAEVAPEDAAPASTATVSHSKAEQQQETQQLHTQQACTDTAGAPEITFKV